MPSRSERGFADVDDFEDSDADDFGIGDEDDEGEEPEDDEADREAVMFFRLEW